MLPGDVIKMEVFAKYVDPNGEDPNSTAWQNLAALVSSISSGSPSVVVDGSGYLTSSYSQFLYPSVLDKSAESTTIPNAYLNYIVFDRNFNPIYDTDQTNFVRVDETAREHGGDGPHQQLYKEITIKQPGYIYIYLSNDSPSPIEVYFDDFKVEQVKSPVLQIQDYYPFGLTHYSYRRENSLGNRWMFQGQEHMDDFGLGWDSFKWRNHQPDIGRFFNVDKLAEKYYYNSPYAFSENKVVAHRELEGLESKSINKKKEEGSTYTSTVARSGQSITRTPNIYWVY